MATTAVAKQSDCQGKRMRLARAHDRHACRLCFHAHDASVPTACSLYPLPCPQHAEALMTKLKPADHTGGRICQHGTPPCVHDSHAARLRVSITARDSVDQTNENRATGGYVLTC